MFSFFAKRAEKKKLEKEKKEQIERKKQIEQMRIDVAKALYAYFDDFDNNRIPNVLIEQRNSVFDNSSEYETTLFSLEPQINKKYK